MIHIDLPEIPINKDVTYLGLTTFRDRNQLFGIKRKDRRQHVYLLGKSGTGKSVLMFNMIIQNIQNGEGVCVVDPHGELVEGILSAIPPHRMKDVVYFNPADADYHIGFNVLELVDPQYKHLVASGLMGIFTKIWENAWSARMEYILNNCILALLDTPGTTLLGIPRMLVDKDYRQKIIANLKDPVIKAFWVHEYEAWQDKFRNEAIAPIQNKVGQFLSTSIIRNVVGQSKSTINVFDIMNDGKIFLVNVSKGRIGEDNSSLLGGMIITKIQLAAMERVRIPEDHRKDFYLYVDEFQNFVTDAFAGILSEARKYRLNLTVAHQYVAQLKIGVNAAMRDAVFGNVGTMIVFRVGADDAEFLENEFDPEFTPSDIVNLPNYKIYLKLMIDGVTSRPFSAKTLPPMIKSGDKKVEEEVIKSSRDLYCRPREVVEQEINNWSGMSLGNDSDTGSGALEKFPVICSLCKKEATVPFKPELGRAVYCKDCIAKIKSGEVKPEKGRDAQIKYDESKFYKPLSDLGIEFEPKNGRIEEDNRYQERGEKDFASESVSPQVVGKSSVFKSIKKVFSPARASGAQTGFTKQAENKKLIPPRIMIPKKPKDNKALREFLDKTLAAKSISELATVSPEVPPQVAISLDTLKNKVKSSSDRAASPENMNKLKDLIQTTSTNAKVLPDKQTAQIPGNEPLSQKLEEVSPADLPSGIDPQTSQPKEVPEDVLRKILE